MIRMTTQEGVHRDTQLIACNEVSTAFGSVSQMRRSGHRVVFNAEWGQEGSYIEHIERGQKNVVGRDKWIVYVQHQDRTNE